jgi:hypothetical protein
VLRSLDAELQRIQQLEADAAPATAPGVPTATPVDVDEQIGPGKEAWRIKFRAEHEVADFQGKNRGITSTRVAAISMLLI